MAFKNAAYETASYHLKSAISYFGASTWTQGIPVCEHCSSVAYERMFNAHLLLARTILAEGDHEAARGFVQSILPLVSNVPQHRAAFLSVVVKSWIGDK